VSIGDLVKNQMAEQERTIQQLVHYIHGNGFQRGHSELKTKSAAGLISQ
jgi:IMP dehydrogenase